MDTPEQLSENKDSCNSVMHRDNSKITCIQDTKNDGAVTET